MSGVLSRWRHHQGGPTAIVLVIGQGAALSSLLLISRNMLPADFGRLSAGLALQNYLVLLGTLGLRTLVTRDLARAPRQLPQIWGTYWAFIAPFGALVAIAGHVIGGLLFERDSAEEAMSLWLAGGAWLSMLSVVPLLDGLNRQRQALCIVALSEVLFLGGVATRMIPLHLSGLGAAIAIKWTLASIMQVMVLSRSTSVRRLQHSRDLAVSWRPSILPLLLTSLIVNLPLTAAVLLARNVFGANEAAVIGLGAQFAAAITLLGGVSVRFLQPMWPDSVALKQSQTRGHFRFLTLGGIVGWLTGCGVVGVVVVGFLRPEYRQELPAILLLLTAGSLGVAARVLWIALLAVNDDRGVLAAYLCGGFAFLVCAMLLMTCKEINLIALATVVGCGSTVLIAWRRVAAGLRIKPGN